MTPEPMTSNFGVMICILYVLLEAGYLLYQKSFPVGISDGSETGQIVRVEKWKRELVSRAAKGTSAVDSWVNGWFENLGKASIRDVNRGNVEEYLSGELTLSITHFGLTI